MMKWRDLMKTAFPGGVLALLLLTFAPAAVGQAWVQLQPQGTPPPGRFNNTAVYDSGSDRLVIFGGFNQSICCPTTNDVWVLTGANGHGGPREWIDLIPQNTPGSPPPLAAASAVYDSQTNQMIIFGGQNGNLGISSDQVWILSNANGLGGAPSWRQVRFPSGPLPIARQNHQAAYDAATNRMIVVGGLVSLGGGTVVLLNDVWVLTNANGTEAQPPVWTQLLPEGIGPSPRHAFAAAYDATTNRLSIVGGCVDAVFACDNSVASTDLWVLSNANGAETLAPSWSVFHFAVAPPAHAQYAVSGYDPAANQLFVMGGRIGASPPFGDFSNLTWALSYVNGLGGTPQWTMLMTGGIFPAPRGQSVAPNLFDPETGRLIVFGGPGLNDTWTLYTQGGALTAR